ncbi:fused response regulator/phosphatase [Tabrizicola sp. TH137]|uniref:PP2C family protein-serine/threonine phosphatase n=1 Tax=Tabrizicola sp. TH137 TaxID=2067452 RepID=UPI000C7BA7EA|nr:SpoIIE family protein phosphatase [Tabrizicola sp. TH137]PLL14564.1 fused response regulator/phosphatase [Tabrizicola sp. TH137]
MSQDAPRQVLVVDDSAAQRQMLSRQLARWGYGVVQAASGGEALALARATDFDIVLSDWVMPGMSGPDFCRAFRALPRAGYGYFVLLSAKSSKDDIAIGLDSGADDFLTKPVDATELLSRLHAGERILAMQAELRRRNADLERIHADLHRDLAEARRLQLSLAPEPVVALGPAELVFLLRPSGMLGGDLVGWFPIAAGRILLFAVDVSGHGVAAALMIARLSALLATGSRDQNIAFHNGRPLPVEAVVARLNRILLSDRTGDLYLTLLCAELDLATGHLRLVQAGHPHPLLLRADGAVLALGEGGLPVGLVPDPGHCALDLHLHPGDRLFIGSDGLIECPGPGRGDLGDDGLVRLLLGQSQQRGTALADGVIAALSDHAGTADFPDDVSAIVLDWHGP